MDALSSERADDSTTSPAASILSTSSRTSIGVFGAASS